MPTLNQSSPVTQSQQVQNQARASANAQHDVEAGAVIEASTGGSGQVTGNITGGVSSEARCADVDDVLARLSNSSAAVSASASDRAAITVASHVDMQVVAEVQTEAHAAAQALGGVLTNQGQVTTETPCDDDEPAPIGYLNTPGQQAPVAQLASAD